MIANDLNLMHVKQITHQLFIVYSWLFLTDHEFVKIKVGFEKIIWFDELWHFPQSAERSKMPTTKKIKTDDCYNSWTHRWRHIYDVITGVKMVRSNKSDIYTLRLTNKCFFEIHFLRREIISTNHSST